MIFPGTDGTLRGKITDSDGAALIGTQIYMPDLGKGTIADADGNYIILNIPVGDYEVRFLMIGYQTKIYENVTITMDQTKWLNPKLGEASIEGEVVKVSSERALVEKGTTSKQVTISKEAIETLPIRDVTELYNLQSGVVKIDSKAKGVPDRAEKGLEEVHVRGGRGGEIAYMIDGMYVRNPIYGGIGSGTRLNKFAIREFDWQPGGFNAEYGDAMSAVSNWHTMSGTSKYSFKFQYDTSLLGEALGSRYDELRNYHDYNFGFGGPVPFIDKIKFWASGQFTNKGAESVLKFDNHVYPFEPGEYFYNYQLYGYLSEEGQCPNGDCIEWVEGGEYPYFSKYDLTFPFDNTSGFKPFGFDTTNDYFLKLTYDITSQHKIALTRWVVNAHKQIFNPLWIYWDEGRQEIFRDTERTAFEFNHTINQKSFYTLRISDFNQDQFIGVRWKDRDNDGLPDWFENLYPAGYAPVSDPNNPNIRPFGFSASLNDIEYIEKDGLGPLSWSSGWHKGAVPGNYNWTTAESFIDTNNNGLYDGPDSSDEFYIDQNPDGTFNVTEHDIDQDGQWDGPQLVKEAIYRDGDYWLTPEMYVSSKQSNLTNSYGAFIENEGMYPYMTIQNNEFYAGSYGVSANEGGYRIPLYFVDYTDCLDIGDGCDDFIFGGTDRIYSETNARTQEIRFDYTNQATDRWRTRVGLDYKTHKLDFYEILQPWEKSAAFRQRFAEQWDDTGVDGYEFIDATPDECNIPDAGEGNGTWDGPQEAINPCTGEIEEYPGESFDDFNGDGKWNSFVEPEEFAMYFQNTYEVPWMVINAGIRLDAVQYNTKVWADADNNFSPYSPHFYHDCGTDVSESNVDDGAGIKQGLVMCPGTYYLYDTNYPKYWNVNTNEWVEWDGIVKIYDNYSYDENFDPTDEDKKTSYGFISEPSSNNPDHYKNWQILNEDDENKTDNGVRDEGEITTSQIEETNNYSVVMFKDSEWVYKISPRIGISHVIADGATFTFNYGLYHQTPIYEFIYRNVSKLEDPLEAFQDAGEQNQSIGNATMTAGRTQSYELAFNVQFSRRWACTAGVWVKDMDELTTADNYNSGIYEYQVAKNGDFGTAVGYDLTIENRGRLFSSTIQYTYSYAKASSEYDSDAFGALEVDAPQQETLMPFDRTHDLTLSIYSTKLPWGLSGGVTGFLQSGEPYTPMIFEGKDPKLDLKNEYSKRAPASISLDMSLSKAFILGKNKFSIGANIFNVFDKPYPLRIYNLTGEANYPGEYYDKNIGREYSSQLYDRPWYYSGNREINFFVRVEFN